MAQLPLYHSASGKPQYASSRKGFSFRDRHLLLVILAVFAIICLGSLYYAPEVMEQVSFDMTYRKFIGMQDENNLFLNADNAVMDDQVSPSKIPPDNEKIIDLVQKDAETIGVQSDVEDVHHQQNLEDVHLQQNLDVHHQQNLEDVHQDAGQEEQHEELINKERIIEIHNSKDYVNVDNKDSDPIVTQRRNKVKEVYMYVCVLIVHECSIYCPLISITM